MAVRLVERKINVPAGAARHEVSVMLPQGTTVLRVQQQGGGEAVVLLRGDPALPDEARYFIAILGDEAPAGVLLTAREAAGVYVGSFQSYARSKTERADLYHIFEVAAP